MASVNDIRSSFLQYFETQGHTVVPSSSLVPNNDPTLMFTNAGMVPFKNVFTGLEKRPYQTAASSQKCVRAGGKHNDLDNVGYTARHHTFFEMLGNFSFGDYFKDRAIELAWNLITKEFALPKDRLLVTVYSEDNEAFDLWKKIAGLPESKIIRIPTTDNFWSMGDTGPCGPCSEIFYDHGDKIWGGPPGSADENGDRFIEIWNLVFMQFEQSADGSRVSLPKPSIDTGMGLERISAVLSGTHDNYATDTMRALIMACAHATGIEPDGAQSASHRVIADHLRASSFLIADGVLPSNEGRGYVLRRIMRRAMRHAELLGSREPLLYRLLPTLVKEMGQAYGELQRHEHLISETLKLEEVKFRRTLERGLVLLDEECASMSAGDTLSGEVAFKLYDTYGFPYDLTEDALRSKQIQVDRVGFDAAMTRQKNEARKAWVGSGDAQTDTIWFDLKEQHGATDFLGYENLQADAQVVVLLKDGKPVDALKAGESARVLFNQTPFYAESGGQVGDIGQIFFEGGFAKVLNTTKELGALFVHHIQIEKGTLAANGKVTLEVDADRRQLIRANHSATHLLHEALREVLGDHVAQKGSMVSFDRLRFDFSHPKPIDGAEKAKIEQIANAIVLQNSPVETHLMDVQAAIDSGARALFGEKYGDEVRVVSMGLKHNSNQKYSVELCGGTHVQNTGQIGLIHVTSESGVASGVRRIEAVCGELARRRLSDDRQLALDAAEVINTTLSELPTRVVELLEHNKKLERALADARKKIAFASSSSDGKSQDVETIQGVKFLARVLSGIPSGELKSIVDEGKTQIGSGVVSVISIDELGKAAVVVGVTSDLTEKFDAVTLVRKASEALGGKGGGGRKDMAQAGGPNGNAANDAIAAIRQDLTGS